MIIDNIRNRHNYDMFPQLRTVLDKMAELMKEDLPAGRITLAEGELFINPGAFTTLRDEDNLLYEAHRKFADVHFIVSGAEKIWVKDTALLSEAVPYSEEKEMLFYSGEGGTECILRRGDFLVCFPNDAHRVSLSPEEPAPVKKLVGKIRV